MMNQMMDEPQPSMPEKKPQKEASKRVIESDRKKDVCLVNAFRSLGVRVPYICGTVLSGHLNEMLRPFGFLAYM